MSLEKHCSMTDWLRKAVYSGFVTTFSSRYRHRSCFTAFEASAAGLDHVQHRRYPLDLSLRTWRTAAVEILGLAQAMPIAEPVWLALLLAILMHASKKKQRDIQHCCPGPFSVLTLGRLVPARAVMAASCKCLVCWGCGVMGCRPTWPRSRLMTW